MNYNTPLSKRQLKKALNYCQDSHGGEQAYNRAFWLEMAIFMLIMMIIVLALRAYVFRIIIVDGKSMLPTYVDGEMVFSERLSYYLHAPGQGEVVICTYRDNSYPVIKRVIATGGQQIEVRGGVTYVDGARLDESAYWNGVMDWDMQPLTVPPGHIFVMGDNRNHSNDSRAQGPVPFSRIIGRVGVVLFKPN